MTSTLSVNVFTAPEKAIIGERPRPWGPAGHKKAGLPDTPDAIEGTKRYLTDFGRLKQSTSGDQELYDAMTGLYPDWASNQTWLMFGLG